MKSLRTVKEAPWIQNTVQYHAGQSPPRRGANSTNHRVATWQSAPPSRGRSVAGCPGVKSHPEYSVPLIPMLTRGRAVVGWLPGIRTGPPAGRPAGWLSAGPGKGWNVSPAPATSLRRGPTLIVPSLRRAGQIPTPDVRRPEPTQTARWHAGWCVCGGCGEGLRGEPRRQSIVKLSRSINDKKASFAQIGYLSFPRQIRLRLPTCVDELTRFLTSAMHSQFSAFHTYLRGLSFGYPIILQHASLVQLITRSAF